MAAFVFKGDGDHAECVVFGLTFPVGEPVDVEDASISARLVTNPMFDAVEAPAPRRRRQIEPEIDGL